MFWLTADRYENALTALSPPLPMLPSPSAYPSHSYIAEYILRRASFEVADIVKHCCDRGLLVSIMANCTQKHTDWVEISSGGISIASKRPLLADSKHLARLVKQLENAADQYPQVVLCVGDIDMQEVGSFLFPDRDNSDERVPRSRLSSSRRTTPQSCAALVPPESSRCTISEIRVDDSQRNSLSPMFLARYTPNIDVPRVNQCTCYDTTQHEVRWANRNHNINNTVLSRLLFPFSNLIYLFADDLGGVMSVADQIEEWSTGTRVTDLPWQALPRVCVVSFGPRSRTWQLQAECFDARLKAIKYHNHFSNVQLLRFHAVRSSKQSADFRRTTMHELEVISEAKKAAKMQFNAVHIVDFFSQATAHLARTAIKPFNFIQASRHYRPVPTTYQEQIVTLLAMRERRGISTDTCNKLVASCFLLDAYPPSSHSECQPRRERIRLC